MKHNVVVATHHKTGTVWMDGVFKAIARDVGVEYVDFRSQYARLADALSKPFILLNHDSNFREYAHILDRHDVRILHVVRDPRDVLISAMHYHRKSSESWLHEPIPGYDNVTYQRRLRTLPTKFDQFTPQAMMRYTGRDPLVRQHLNLLQKAMAYNNFYGLRVEWWHFTTADWKKYIPYWEDPQLSQASEKQSPKS